MSGAAAAAPTRTSAAASASPIATATAAPVAPTVSAAIAASAYATRPRTAATAATAYAAATGPATTATAAPPALALSAQCITADVAHCRLQRVWNAFRVGDLVATLALSTWALDETLVVGLLQWVWNGPVIRDVPLRLSVPLQGSLVVSLLQRIGYRPILRHRTALLPLLLNCALVKGLLQGAGNRAALTRLKAGSAVLPVIAWRAVTPGWTIATRWAVWARRTVAAALRGFSRHLPLLAQGALLALAAPFATALIAAIAARATFFNLLWAGPLLHATREAAQQAQISLWQVHPRTPLEATWQHH